MKTASRISSLVAQEKQSANKQSESRWAKRHWSESLTGWLCSLIDFAPAATREPPARRLIKERIRIWSRIIPWKKTAENAFYWPKLTNCFALLKISVRSWWIHKLRMFRNNCEAGKPSSVFKRKKKVISLVTYYTFHGISTFLVQQNKTAKFLRNFSEISSKSRWDIDSLKSTFAPERTFGNRRPRAKREADL